MELANSGLIWSGSLVLGLIYWYVTKKQNFWSQLGVPGPKPTFLIGNLDRFRKSVSEFEIGCTRKYGPVYGLYLGLKPVLTITDPELVKRVLVRDFNHFVDRLVINTSHSIMTQHLLLLQGDRWKRTRAIVTPTFTSGKLRGMQQLMNRAVDKLSDYFDKLLNDAGQGKFTTKEVISGFTIDVIASTTFATETNANDDRSNRNPFVINGIKMFDVNPLKILFVQALPKWFNINVLGVEYFPPKEPAEFFMNLTRTIVQQRKSASTSASASTSKKHTDLVQLLVDASIDESELNTTNWNKLTAEVEPNENEITDDPQDVSRFQNNKKQCLTENEIIAQCIIFFVAGFETTASTISHCLFELIKNQDIQQRLCDELRTILDDQRLDINSSEYYDKITNRIPYLDAVVKETLRKYPPVVRLNRMMTSDRYRLTDSLELERGQSIDIGVYSIHHNPDYYPDPERFDPERFMPENKHLLEPYAFLPFGTGPRNCVGMRFAFQEIKMMLARIIPRYRFDNTTNTPDQLQFKLGGTVYSALPYELGISKRIQ